MSKVLRIERVVPPDGPPEVPLKTPRGYQLANPAGGGKRNCVEHAVFVSTLDEAARLMTHGYPLWMKQEGKRATLICPSSLRIVTAPP